MTSLHGAILDVDGTVVRGDERLPGALEGIRSLRAAGLDVLYCSNNPTRPVDHHVARLRDHGVAVDPWQVLTADVVTVEYLATEHPGSDLFVVGEPHLCGQLRDAGFALTEDPEAADVLVASIDREFDYDDLCTALWALERDIPFIGTDPDVVIPAPERDVPGSGAVINAIAGVAEREPDAVLGKPSDTAIEMVRERLPYPAEECLVVGDRLDTDIALGERAGMTTVLVRSGVTDDDDLAASAIDPDHVIDHLGEIDRVVD